MKQKQFLILIFASTFLMLSCKKDAPEYNPFMASSNEFTLKLKIKDNKGVDLLAADNAAAYKLSDIAVWYKNDWHKPEKGKNYSIENSKEFGNYLSIQLERPEQKSIQRNQKKSTYFTETYIRFKTEKEALIKAEYTVTFANNPEMYGGSLMILTKAWYDNNLIYEKGKTADIVVVVK